MKLMIADTSEALIAITPTGAGAAARFRGGPPVIVFREYFELKWKLARLLGRASAPASAAGTPINPVQREIMVLLDEGLTDAQIARHVHLSVGSIRRHINEIKGKLGANTRWAACVEAHRRGWVGAEPASPPSTTKPAALGPSGDDRQEGCGGSAGLREDDLLRREVRASRVVGVQPDCLRVLRVAAPPCRVLAGAGWQLLSDDLGHFGEGHLDP
jgi:DNA-binding CsgD family transcriptional regulator